MTDATFDEIKDQLRESALTFGRGLRRWRVANGWAQDTSMRWGQEANIPHVYSSQWSMLETGAAKNPGAQVFFSFGQQNRMLAARQYGKVATRALLDRLKNAQPELDESGRPWDGVDFFRCYTGQIAWPLPPEPAPLPTQEEADELSAMVRESFRNTARLAGLSLATASVQLLGLVPVEEAEGLKAVLLGDDWTPGEVADLLQGVEDPLPMVWLREWAGTLNRGRRRVGSQSAKR